MYGLKQAAILAYKQLVKHLHPFGYSPVSHPLSLWIDNTNPNFFCLCVDDFGVKYYSKEDALHLINTLKQGYSTPVDWEGKKYCGYTLDLNYEKGYVDVSMPTYIPKMLAKYNHPSPTQHQ